MNEIQLLGIHHVTAIAGDPQENVDFYIGTLGLRLVKRSVNQDDPGTYHLFYGDALGHPGTELTFFPWPDGQPGRKGTGQTVTVAFAVPEAGLAYWMRRLKHSGISFEGPFPRFEEEVIAFSDPHSLSVELVAGAATGHRELWSAWESGPVPPEFAIRGIHSVALKETGVEPTSAFLTDTLGFRLTAEIAGRFRFELGDPSPGSILDLLPLPREPRGRVAVGTIHHVAWRTPDAPEQRLWREQIAALGTSISPIIDRFWFRSVYFPEPGGVLFEIATDGPGFTVDETPETLGDRLILPPWLEPKRAQLEAVLPPLRMPQLVRQA